MIRRRVKVQLLVFVLVTMLSVGYAAVQFFEIDEVFTQPYEVSAQFSNAGGIFPRADVELLGTRIGKVKEVQAGPGRGSTVVMEIDHGVRIPADVHAMVGSKSAIGEQYVGFTPRSARGRALADGDVVPLASTTSPIEVSTLLANVTSFIGSVNTTDVGIVLDEMSAFFDGMGPTMGRLIEDSDTLTKTELEYVHTQTALIEDAKTVLDTQVDKADQTTTYLREWAGFVETLSDLSPAFADLFTRGVLASDQITRLLLENQRLLPILLGNLITLADLGNDNLPSLRKVLTLLPWMLELGASTIRYCDEINPKTGEPIAATCHYDSEGKPIYAIYQADQELAGSPAACTKGYEATVKHYPDGTPVDGGPTQPDDFPVNSEAACTASPDSDTPNVRGAQNAEHR